MEVAATTREDLAAAGVDPAGALWEPNRRLRAVVQTEHHRRVHTEIAQSPLDRWSAPLG
ncbi:MAG: hypothetical protein PHQ28_04915 [Mycobacterium sp.]|nr:hypothetical protein [Mycobacterium sp.]